MHWSPRAMRVGLIASFAVPALFILTASALQAQVRPPIQPRPPIGPPKIERVWTCGKCGREIGRGAFAPATCPHCGVKLVNGVGNGGDRPFNPNPPIGNPNPRPPFTPPPPNVEPAPPINIAPPPPVQNGNDTEPAQPPQRSNTGLIIGLVVGGALFAVLGIIVLGGGVYLFAIRKGR